VLDPLAKAPAPARAAARLLLLAALAAPAGAQEPRPASVLVFPVIRDGAGFNTLVAVTNSNLTPTSPFSLGGTTNVKYSYVESIASPPIGNPAGCRVFERTELLTPADTRVITVACDNLPLGVSEGYLVVEAQDPTELDAPWSHNYLIGSEVVVSGFGALYAQVPIGFFALQQDGALTDLDQDGQLDFDGIEYSGAPDRLLMDTFVGGIGQRLVLIGLTGGAAFDTRVGLDVWNDNEFPLSAVYEFRCWTDTPIASISPLFDPVFLANNTTQDPSETDLDCDDQGDLEGGWLRLRGLVASSVSQSAPNPSIVGVVAGGQLGLERGRPLWRTGERFNGKFLTTTAIDPEL